MAEEGPSLASLAVRNPLFQEAGKKAAFEALQQEEGDNELFNPNARPIIDPSALEVDENELAAIRKWARTMKLAMLIISTLMIITAWYNIGSSTTQVSDGFVAMYLFFFAILICCFELAIKRIAVLLVQNFGFMYNAAGRFMFLIFVGFLCFDLSTMGKVVFGLLMLYGLVNIYLNFKHPQYSKYLRAMHAYNTAKAKRGPPMIV